ncbi:MAG: Methyltransferase type 12 [Parcubacteria group bacterium]|nr:Methyltransferase type 12 [Parcubacteria group bacterium]
MQQFNDKQKLQEVSYKTPYHWFSDDALSQNGRLYFGYLNFCVSIVKKFGNGSILDAGCGDGRFLGQVAKLGDNYSLFGADYSERAIEFARLLVPQGQFSTSNLSKLQYGSNSFDAVFLIETLEHIEPSNISMILKESSRVLKKDGVLIVTVPSSLQGIPPSGSKHYQHFTTKSLTETASEYFRVDTIFGQDRACFHILKLLYKLIDNKFIDIKPLRKFYNKHIWTRYFNVCDKEKGRRLIAIFKKKNI